MLAAFITLNKFEKVIGWPDLKKCWHNYSEGNIAIEGDI